MKLISFLLFFLFGFSFFGQTYIYSDGNANTFKIFKQKIEYVPVTKENSSSGIYSGGEPKTVNINAQQYDSLRSILEEGIKAKAFHSKQREKQSGLIIKTHRRKKEIILQPRSAIRHKIETYLEQLVVL